MKERQFHEELSSVYARLHSLAVTFVANSTDADDVLQETCVLLWEKFDEYDNSKNFYRWAAGFLTNVVRRFFQKRRRSKQFAFSNEVLSRISHVRSGTEELLELRDEQLEKCLRRLTADQAELIWECYANDQKVVEYARAKRIAPNTVYSRLHRVRNELYRCVNNALGLKN
ncbi:ECF RNA polymerase sigma factor SigR [Calycomorphotria hydatis]|uniref:ECF RNA polymerase sigma factor SigR n=2 Tax=Calycomorphotria hydatis TaxID=2528027 RepID=A0A517TBI8_9PLAN|nr:ECF RNA polymerase sigma factor SigR [Calycomorphotria hydatis]